jgi:hypothetical protein
MGGAAIERAYSEVGFFFPFCLTGRFFGLTANKPSTAFSKGRGILLL